MKIKLEGFFNPTHDNRSLAAILVHYITTSYALEENPLSALRKNFPKFEWRLFHSDASVETWGGVVDEIKDAHVVCAFPACDEDAPADTVYLIGKSTDTTQPKSYAVIGWDTWSVDDYRMVQSDQITELQALGFTSIQLG